ncbi:MAG: hypothetical protein ACYDAR_22035 [Thermomicrobiales bacterium]
MKRHILIERRDGGIFGLCPCCGRALVAAPVLPRGGVLAGVYLSARYVPKNADAGWYAGRSRGSRRHREEIPLSVSRTAGKIIRPRLGNEPARFVSGLAAFTVRCACGEQCEVSIPLQ